MKARSPEKMDFRSYWRFQIYVWSFQGISTFLFMATMPPFLQWRLITTEVMKIGVLALVSHGIALISFSSGWLDFKRRKLMLTWLAACMVAGILPTILFYPASREIYGFDYNSPAVLFLSEYVCNVSILVMWGAFFLAFSFYALNNRSEVDRVRTIAASKEAQLAALKHQLNPHFLFNSFNVLRALVQHEPAIARDAITHLAEMMRHSLQLTHKDTIPLSRELDFVESYLALERLRYEERLRVSADVPDELGSVSIPSMLLYALVENAVKYGIDQNREGADVSYTFLRDGNHLFLRVVNSGRLAEPGTSTGTGLINITDRLKLLYGDEASLSVSEVDGQVVAEVTWPVNTNKDIS